MRLKMNSSFNYLTFITHTQKRIKILFKKVTHVKLYIELDRTSINAKYFFSNLFLKLLHHPYIIILIGRFYICCFQRKRIEKTVLSKKNGFSDIFNPNFYNFVEKKKENKNLENNLNI